MFTKTTFASLLLAILVLPLASLAQDAGGKGVKEDPKPAAKKEAAGKEATKKEATDKPKEGEEEAKPTPQPDNEHESKAKDRVTAEEILREFQKERPTARPLRPGEGDGPDKVQPTRMSAADSTRPRLPDGYFLVDRTGTLVQEGEWWMFVFVSDNNPEESPDPPIKLLPNQMLERAVRESQGAGDTVEFIVSGEVTDFMGKNYLLLRKLMRKRSMGNLTK